jgi:hypothetical protein
MDEIGAGPAPEPAQAAAGGQAEAEQGIARDGQAGQEVLRDRTADLEGGGVLFGALAGADDRDPVPQAREALHEVPQRHGDAVDFGRVGFGYEDKVQAGWPGRRRPAGRRARRKHARPA